MRVWRNSASTPATAPPCARWPLSTAAWSPATWRARYSAGTTPGTIAVLALAVRPAVGFYVERTSATPMLPLAILAAPTSRASVAAMLLIGAILAGYVYFTSLYLQKVLGFSPVATGRVDPIERDRRAHLHPGHPSAARPAHRQASPAGRAGMHGRRAALARSGDGRSHPWPGRRPDATPHGPDARPGGRGRRLTRSRRLGTGGRQVQAAWRSYRFCLLF